jgi:ferredoxin
MNEPHSPLSTFYFTGQISGDSLFEVGGRGLHPALFSAYGDISKLRYDYPLVLIKGINGGPRLRSISDIVTDILREIAPPGNDGEALRKHLLHLEGELRALAQDGFKGTLLELWKMAEANLRSQVGDSGDGAVLDENLSAARKALSVDGVIVDYDEETARKVLTHEWTGVQEAKISNFSHRLDELTLKLSNILKGDSMKSARAYDPDALKMTVGSSFEQAFDFESMSDILGTAFVAGALPEKRWRRIRSVLSTLKSQKFFPSAVGNGTTKRRRSSAYVFEHCAPAIEEFGKRLPKMVKLVKAMTIGQLEIDGRYRESSHDSFFRHFDERYLEADDLSMFPSYLICLHKGQDAKAEKADLVEILSSGLPFKVLLQNHDIVEELSIASGQFSFGVRGSQLTSLALGLDSVFVLQASGADLYRMRESILGGLNHGGPTLFNIFSGRAGGLTRPARNAPDTPLYLRAAAASESRSFPVFVHDPAGGKNRKSRFSVDGNPQPEVDWPVHRFEYEDQELQRISEDIAFTFVDFAALDDRYADRFARVPRSAWRDEMVPVCEFLELEDRLAADKVPYILMVDDNNALHRVIVEVRLIQAARRCREMWHNLRELGGINNSRAIEAAAADSEIQDSPAKQDTAASDDRGTDADSGERADEEFTAPPSGEPYIETLRCTTCEECIEINKRMFAYDDNKQAFIADLKAGTYRQMVEAAESCQVAIIHPGQPVNSQEPNLKELILRAELFN